MFKRLLPISSLVTILFFSITTFAQNFNTDNSNQTNQDMQDLVEYVLNLGGYLGFNLKEEPSSVNSNLIVSIDKATVNNTFAVFALIGARPVNSLISRLVPPIINEMQIFNGYVNFVYKNPNYNSPSKDNVSVSTLVDQLDYQEDPISQAVLNVIATPSDSNCMNYDGTIYLSGCDTLTQGQVTINAIGELPGYEALFDYEKLKSILPQLSANSLIGPLLYSTEDPNQSQTSSPRVSGNQNKGLQSPTQAQAAQNFIRHASGSLLRPEFPSRKTYEFFLRKATDKNASLLEKKAAQKRLSQFLTQTRAYAAQASIGVSNLYWILAKRMPQNPLGSEQQQPTSQALSEFKMATGRLFNPDADAKEQWTHKINTSSPATVQKEIALLLAEINYQLYLNRQLQEKILLTNSVNLLTSISQTKPDGSTLGAVSSDSPGS